MPGRGKTTGSLVKGRLRWSERRAAAQPLRRLERILQDGETPVDIATGRIQSDAGVLAITTRRVLFVASSFEREADRSEVVWAEGRQEATGGMLVLRLADGGGLRIGSLNPPGCAERIAGVLQAGAADRPPAGRRFVREPVWRVTRADAEHRAVHETAA